MGRLSKELVEAIIAECQQIEPEAGPRAALRSLERKLEWALEEADDGEHLDFVNVVEVEGRENPVYVFAELRDAGRFARAVKSEALYRSNQAIYTGAAAERLIASERADVLEGKGFGGLAEKVRTGIDLTETVARLSALKASYRGLDFGEVEVLLQRWAEEDAREGGR